jgi:hypothetical protein
MSHIWDEYKKVQAYQNEGVECPYCEAGVGHYVSCPLLNGGSTVDFLRGKLMSQDTEPQLVLTTEDDELLKAMHIKL